MKNKASIRKDLLNKRRSLKEDYCLLYEESIFDSFKKIFLQENPEKIGLYWSSNNEVRTNKISDFINTTKKDKYLPVVGFNNSLTFRKFKKNSPLIKNKYGIKEPLQGEETNGNKLDLVLIPLVGFDRSLNRLGMGGGYYDRTFKDNKRPFLIGLAYQFQEIKDLGPKEHDIPLDIIITADQIFKQ